MKGCLKQSSRAPSPTADHPSPSSAAKHVAFDPHSLEQVFFADEWDRTPAEPARNLSYQDILELKEIQRSLPRAIQPADLIGSRPASHYLSNVPIGLLPLLPESDNTPPQPSSTVASTLTFSQNSWRTVRTPAPSIPHPVKQSSTWHPPHLSHLPPARPPIHRPKGRFAFLPLLDSQQGEEQPQSSTPTPTPSGSRSRTPSPPASPPPSERSSSPDFFDVSHDPPTPSLTNASVDSSPLSRASSCSPEPTFLQLPPSCGHGRFCGVKSNTAVPKLGTPLADDRLGSSESWMNMRDTHDYRRPGFGAARSPVSSIVTATAATAATAAAPSQDIPPPPSTPTNKKDSSAKPKKKKNVIVINDIEIELDDDGQDQADIEEESSTPPAKAPSIPHISSPTPTRPTSSPPRLQPQQPTSPTINAHTPIFFKRSMPNQATSCSPPRSSSSATGGQRSNPVLVPSA
ncbi:hypothetical protein D9756_002736 [Leucocoprinus leucothites]|uniref:Uncharacterized protein n=1 Tax=Leucocoprinus leucothites TaxID=201217 RepID=A0A8H5GCU8_9AGAR|nr:hypothetical protein D9756_002736 [Leucoagaricus leucothites]